MAKKPVEASPSEDSGVGKPASGAEEFISLIVPEPDLLEEERAAGPGSEPRTTGS